MYRSHDRIQFCVQIPKVAATTTVSPKKETIHEILLRVFLDKVPQDTKEQAEAKGAFLILTN